MTDLLLTIGLSNACFSLALAIVAVVVARTTRRPHLANLLWLLVLVKLVTPPLVTVPGLAISDRPDTPEAGSISPSIVRPVELSGESAFDGSRVSLASPGETTPGQSPIDPESGFASSALKLAEQSAGPLWLAGSLIVLVWSLLRVARFSGLLKAESSPAPQKLQDRAGRIARRLKLRRVPLIRITSARISPMVWWTGGKVLIVIPEALLDSLDARQLKWILAHELAHVRRGDHLVRWLEWLACVSFWWNPVVWLARRNLRATEEICCDALVISSLHPKPHSYAQSLLAAVESLVRPAIRPPATASEINSGGFLERRLKMIVSSSPKKSKSLRIQACVLLCALIVLPLGAASAQDLGAVWARLQTAVKKGEINQQQAHMMMGALKGSLYKEKKEEHRDRRPDRAKIDAHAREIWSKLQHAVKEGKMSQKDAEQKMGRIKRELLSKFHKKPEHRREGDHRQRVDAHLKQVWAGLQRAVREGKISQEDAHRKMGEMKKKLYGKPEHRDKDKARRRQPREKGGEVLDGIARWVHKVGEDLRKSAESGKITGEQAMNKWRGFKEHQLAPKLKACVKEGKMSEQTARWFWEHVEIHERIDAAVRAGEISKQDADRKKSELKRQAHARFAPRDERPRPEHRKEGGSPIEHIDRWTHSVSEDIKKAAAAGKITDKQAWAKWHGFKKSQLAPKLHAAVKEGKIREADAKEFMRQIALSEAGEHLKAAVGAGKISEKDARRKFEEIKKGIYSGDNKDKKPQDRARHYLMKVRKDLGEAVKAGKISREDAAKKFAETEKAVRARMAHARKQRGGGHDTAKRPNWDSIKQRIEGAVKRGDMTRAEADAKYKEIKEKTSGKHRR